MSESWLPVVGYEGVYEVSDYGNLRSVDRIVVSRNPDRTYFQRGRPIKPRAANDGGYSIVGLWLKGKRRTTGIHRLVLAAFVGPRPQGCLARHLNGNPEDNRLRNLAYGTPSENNRDCIRHGRHNHAQKTRCKWGHLFDELNTYISPTTGQRFCRSCKNKWMRDARRDVRSEL